MEKRKGFKRYQKINYETLKINVATNNNQRGNTGWIEEAVSIKLQTGTLKHGAFRQWKTAFTALSTLD